MGNTFSTTTSSGSVATYATQQDLEDLFGVDNLARWSQLDNDTDTADASRITRALQAADADINIFFRGGPYATPLIATNARPTLTHWAAAIAGAWLYDARGNAPG